MNTNAIVFAMANPDPEILPDEAKKGGAMVIATGRSDFPNQVNNVLVFPGIFRAVLDMRAHEITKQMHLVAARALAESVSLPTPEKILPSALEKGIAQKVAEAVKKCV
jgi:malate dehydrogenase (oxaloacetate-decarboxylating)